MDRHFGMMLAAVGVVLVIAGLLWSAGAMGWSGRLPGDVRIERGNFRIFVPVATMILASLVADPGPRAPAVARDQFSRQMAKFRAAAKDTQRM
jgi:hypothetical protein